MARGRWTNLHFYCIEDMEGLLKGRGRFIVEREFYENPEDPYHRNHMFLPFDHRIGSTFLDADEVWEVGGSDESGFSEALFLAEKNVYYPSKQEVATLETYVQDCLFKYIQNPRPTWCGLRCTTRTDTLRARGGRGRRRDRKRRFAATTMCTRRISTMRFTGSERRMG